MTTVTPMLLNMRLVMSSTLIWMPIMSAKVRWIERSVWIVVFENLIIVIVNAMVVLRSIPISLLSVDASQ